MFIAKREMPSFSQPASKKGKSRSLEGSHEDGWPTLSFIDALRLPVYALASFAAQSAFYSHRSKSDHQCAARSAQMYRSAYNVAGKWANDILLEH